MEVNDRLPCIIGPYEEEDGSVSIYCPSYAGYDYFILPSGDVYYSWHRGWKLYNTKDGVTWK